MDVKWLIRIFSKTSATEAKIQLENIFFHVCVLSYLSIANTFASFVKVLKL